MLEAFAPHVAVACRHEESGPGVDIFDRCGDTAGSAEGDGVRSGSVLKERTVSCRTNAGARCGWSVVALCPYSMFTPALVRQARLLCSSPRIGWTTKTALRGIRKSQRIQISRLRELQWGPSLRPPPTSTNHSLSCISLPSSPYHFATRPRKANTAQPHRTRTSTLRPALSCHRLSSPSTRKTNTRH